MGYTHYWSRVKEIPQPIFDRIVADFRKTLPAIQAAEVALAGPDGSGEPVITTDEVAFNGVEHCGHPRVDLGVAWPTEEAKGVWHGNPQVETIAEWSDFGALLATRRCDGDCSHETFYFPRIANDSEESLAWDFCKTAFKPYDLAVCVFLVIAKHYLDENMSVESDGTRENWADAIEICQTVLGYGQEFTLESEAEEDEDEQDW